jgi:hypothetical protein
MKKKEPKMLTVSEVAQQTGAAERSVRLWAKDGKFPGATLVEPPAGVSYWLIPETALEGFALRGRGRPPKPKAEANKSKSK